ncbi:MAG: hypothetical protein PHU27_00180 [Salinivirgaceae bacterium]|nr:hypothetical protein [Salinivirgaceae bacterium]MDD4746030.1 hypothetical protein [Salinivirgaceae bacterium]MDY0279367.1 hypothetical protein [Salinivirgaceae bacterium]
MTTNNPSKQALIQNILIGVLIILVGVMGILYFVEKKKNIQQVEVNEDLNYAKDSIENRLVDMISEYETLKTNNNEINEQLLGEKERVKELLQRIRNERNYSHSKFTEYEKELGTLRKIMRSYIVQIDSLNQSNIALRSENRTVKKQIQKVETEKEEITKRFDEAAEKVDIASSLRPINISLFGVNRNDRDVSRSRNVMKFKTCFTIDANQIAKPGARYIYVRVRRPDKLTIENQQNDTIIIDEIPIIYSARREIDYQNQSMDVCVYVDAPENLPKGIYQVDIYADLRYIGTGSTTLK